MRWRFPLLLGLLILGGAAIAGAATKGPRGPEVLPGGHKVVVCHAADNSFTRIEVDVDSIVRKSGHGSHAHDIVPPFSYRLSPNEGVQHYPGRNWDAQGEAIWTNGCSRPSPPAGKIEVFACVDVQGSSFDATFGYKSASGPVEIAAGPSNGFDPEPVDRGQVTRFKNGYVPAAFTVKEIAEPELTWTVEHGGQSDSVTVSRSSAPCSLPPSPEAVASIGVFVTCVANHGSSFDAVFGYDSENSASQTIPLGTENHFSPAPGDRGQPTTFRPGNFPEAVKVTGIPDSVALKWTLAFVDTRTATATADFDVKCNEPEPSPRPFGIFATCATRHGSTYDATFGYVNESVHSLKIPIGERNAVSPGPDDQGQPETFAPGFVDAAFAVRGVPSARSVTWRVELDGEVRVAHANVGLPACLTDSIDAVADAAISKSATPHSAIVGGQVTSRILLRNGGSAVIRPAEIKDVFRGSRLRILSVGATRGRCRVVSGDAIDSVRCRAITLAPGASLRVRVTAVVLEAGTARDRTVILRLSDPTPGDNAATAAVQVMSPPPGRGLG